MRLSQTQHSRPFIDRFKDGVDSVIEIFSPKAAFLRRYARNSSRMFSSYAGASKSRLRSSWLPGGGSADSDLLPDLPYLRERSRDLGRNEGYAAGIFKTMGANIIGTGIKPQSRLKYEEIGISKEEAEKFQKSAEAAFEKWVPEADACGRLDFYEMQELVVRQILENGESIIIPMMVKDAGRKFSTAYQVVESDRLMTPYDRLSDKTIRDGVELGERGQPVAYWIKKTHPGDTIYEKFSSNDFVRYPAVDKFGRKNVFHIFKQERAGQTRGIPILSPVLGLFKDLSSYVEAEVLKNRIAACFAALIKKNDPLASGTGRTSSTNSSGQRLETIEPGTINYLGIGEDVSMLNPPSTAGTFDPFIERLLRNIAAAINLPYEIVAKDFSRTNYSSARAAILDAVKFLKIQQEWIAKRLCAPVYEAVLEEAYLKEMIQAQNFYTKFSSYCRVKWQKPGWQWVDPLREVQAAQESVNSGFRSRADINEGDLGTDWEETMEQIATERKRAKELGLEDIYGVKPEKQKAEEVPDEKTGRDQRNKKDSGNKSSREDEEYPEDSARGNGNAE